MMGYTFMSFGVKEMRFFIGETPKRKFMQLKSKFHALNSFSSVWLSCRFVFLLLLLTTFGVSFSSFFCLLSPSFIFFYFLLFLEKMERAEHFLPPEEDVRTNIVYTMDWGIQEHNGVMFFFDKAISVKQLSVKSKTTLRGVKKIPKRVPYDGFAPKANVQAVVTCGCHGLVVEDLAIFGFPTTDGEREIFFPPNSAIYFPVLFLKPPSKCGHTKKRKKEQGKFDLFPFAFLLWNLIQMVFFFLSLFPKDLMNPDENSFLVTLSSDIPSMGTLCKIFRFRRAEKGESKKLVSSEELLLKGFSSSLEANISELTSSLASFPLVPPMDQYSRDLTAPPLEMMNTENDGMYSYSTSSPDISYSSPLAPPTEPPLEPPTEALSPIELLLPPLSFSSWSLPPFDANSYVHRKAVIRSMSEKLEKGLSTPSTILWLKGGRGSGKTAIATFLVHKIRLEYPLRMWFQWRGQKDLLQQFASFAKTKNIDPDESSVKYWLENSANGRWLIIFDGVEDYKSIQSFLPSKGGDIIITTKSHESRFHTFTIGEMTKEEVMEMVKKTLPEENLKSIQEFAEKVNGYPAEVQSVLAEIQRRATSIEKYFNGRKILSSPPADDFDTVLSGLISKELNISSSDFREQIEKGKTTFSFDESLMLDLGEEQPTTLL
jgi:hypothetical protein